MPGFSNAGNLKILQTEQGNDPNAVMSQAAVNATKVAKYQGAENLGKLPVVNEQGNFELVDLYRFKAESFKIVDTLPSSNIDGNTYYLTKALRPKVMFGQYCSNKVSYPKIDVPSFAASVSNSYFPQFMIYSHYDNRFYLYLGYNGYQNTYLTTVRTDGLQLIADVTSSNNFIKVMSWAEGEADWTVAYDSWSRDWNIVNYSEAAPFKVVWVRSDFDIYFEGTSESNKISFCAKQEDEDFDNKIFFAKFYDSTGQYLDNDLDNIDDSKFYIYNLNVYRNNNWEVVGQADIKLLMNLFAQTADVITIEQAIADSGKIFRVNSQGNLELDNNLFIASYTESSGSYTPNTGTTFAAITAAYQQGKQVFARTGASDLIPLMGVSSDSIMFGTTALNSNGDPTTARLIHNSDASVDVDIVQVATASDLSTVNNTLGTRIDTLELSSDVVDVVGTITNLTQYNTSTLTDNDIVKVLVDSGHSDATTYYRWLKVTTPADYSYVDESGANKIVFESGHEPAADTKVVIVYKSNNVDVYDVADGTGSATDFPLSETPDDSAAIKVNVWKYVGSEGPYYTKSQVYNKTEIDNMIGDIDSAINNLSEVIGS